MRIHKITRRNFMKVAGVSALAMGLAACGGSSSSTAASTSTAGSAAGGEVTGDKVVINIGHINDESDSWHQGALKFKEYCEANSNGTIEVDVFPNSQLGPEVDMIQGILSDSGTVDITFTGESMQTYQPDLGMIGMPYLIQSDEQMEKVLTGEVGQEFEGPDGGLRHEVPGLFHPWSPLHHLYQEDHQRCRLQQSGHPHPPVRYDRGRLPGSGRKAHPHGTV